MPTVELARVIMDYVIPRSELYGLYHVSAEPISKFDLLSLVAKIYGKKIEIIPDNEFIIDRSLNSELFQTETGYRAPDRGATASRSARPRISRFAGLGRPPGSS